MNSKISSNNSLKQINNTFKALRNQEVTTLAKLVVLNDHTMFSQMLYHAK